jgi:hypothetical protein
MSETAKKLYFRYKGSDDKLMRLKVGLIDYKVTINGTHSQEYTDTLQALSMAFKDHIDKRQFFSCREPMNCFWAEIILYFASNKADMPLNCEWYVLRGKLLQRM